MRYELGTSLVIAGEHRSILQNSFQMDLHPFQFGLLKALIRHKVNGHYSIKLTVAQRHEIAKTIKGSISESYCKRVLSENGKPPKTLSQQSLDGLAAYAGYKNWSNFTNLNPVPPALYFNPPGFGLENQPGSHVINRLNELLFTHQIKIEFPVEQ